MLPCVWLLILDVVTSLTTDNNGDAREEDHATHGPDKSKSTLDFLPTLHGTLLVIVVGGGRNDHRWLHLHHDDDDDDDDDDDELVSQLVFYSTFSTNRLYHAIEVGNVSP